MNNRNELKILLVVLVISILACANSDSNTNTQTNIQSANNNAVSVPDNEPGFVNFESTATVEALLTNAALAQTQASEALQATSTPIPTKAQASQPTIIVLEVADHDCVPDNTQRDLAILVRVIDGDTIEVVVNGQTQRVRYIGMDTPESGDPYFTEATNANENLIAGQTLTLIKDVSETDRYGRLLRYVFVGDDVFVNYELVKQGYAQIATYPPDVACQQYYLEAETQARELALGLWGFSQVIPTSPPATSAPQPQPGKVVIDYILYDGAVARVESDEYIVIKNTGSSAVDITNWRINADDPGQDFYFPAFTLQPGQVCRVYTNEIHPETCGFSFGINKAIWANAGDCGHLYDASGAEVDTYCY